ncbi:MAG: glycoside hydrolase domain-containing protein [Armatimonadota bacterium]
MFRPHFFFLGILVFLTAQCAGAIASVKLFDFESDNDPAAWSMRSPDQDSITLSDKYATSGLHSLEFHTPSWKAGMENWPAFQGVPTVKDWNGYDRFVIDIANPGSESLLLSMFISDSKPEFRNGLQHDYMLPGRSINRYVVDISKMPDAVDRSDISIVHFYTNCPTKDTRVYIDNITLLKPGEALPEIPASMFKDEIAFINSRINAARDAADKCAKLLGKKQDSRLTILAKELDYIESADKTDFNSLAGFSARVDVIDSQLNRLLTLITLRDSLKKLEIPTESMLVGIASSTKKVLPRDVPPPVEALKSISISAARNEKESFQVAVTPSGITTLKGVTVGMSDLRSNSGEVLSASNINCDVVGYVKTKEPCYKVSYVGWWPDPILDFVGPVDIDWENVQTFWVRVKVPKGQVPGLYKGKLTVSAQGAKPVVLGVILQVRSFTLPDCTPIPTAITALTGDHVIKDICGEENWQKKLKYDYADFLADYYVNFDHLYNPGPPDYDILKHLHDQGRLVAFNLGNIDNAGNSVDHFKPIYEKCKELGILDHAYIYGFDEVGSARFEEIAGVTKSLKNAFPDVLLMTTAKDLSCGKDSPIKSIDAWCPLTPDYDLDKVVAARAAGKKVWWYICCGPHNPYANWFVEYDAIESRLLMGAMTAKYRPDGFLYYSLALWNDNMPITSGPFTNWNPKSFGEHNGDGSIFCCGPGGKPIPTIRLENYRDGLEDFAYVKILESIIDKYNAKGDSLTKDERKWLDEARKAVVVPKSLVNDMVNYSHDPKVLFGWRDKIADMIDTSGMSDIDPWGKDFGVRGFDSSKAVQQQ